MATRRFVDNTRLGRELARLEEEDPEVRAAADELERFKQRVLEERKRRMAKRTFYIDLWPGWSTGNVQPMPTMTPTGTPYAGGKRYKFTLDIPDDAVDGVEEIKASAVEEVPLEGES